MHDLIPRALHWLRLLFAPGTGKQRRPRRDPFPRLHLTPASSYAPQPVHLPSHRSPYGLAAPLDGAACALVRPYLAAHERGAALQQRRHPALMLDAGFGIDRDRHLIGEQGVAA